MLSDLSAPPSGAPLVDHAVIVGAPGTLQADANSPPSDSWVERAYGAELLSEYPASRPLQSRAAVAAFCLPYGLRLSVTSNGRSTHLTNNFGVAASALKPRSRIFGRRRLYVELVWSRDYRCLKLHAMKNISL